MATYRQIYMKFWNDDSKVVDDFTPEDKYFYLYLLTNPHTTLTGCYEISEKQMARETGYNEETIRRLRDRMEQVHKVICYEPSTKEVLIPNWHKYNWTSSDKLLTAINEQLKYIKCEAFRNYIAGLANGDTVSIPYRYPMDTSVSVTVSDTVTVHKSDKEEKHKYGEFQHVLLSDKDYAKLKEQFPDQVDNQIRNLDEYLENHPKKHYANHYLTIRNWASRDQAQAPKLQRKTEYRVG